MKYLGPYKQYRMIYGEPVFARLFLKGRGWRHIRYNENLGKWHDNLYVSDPMYFDTKEEAMEYLDNNLISQGYTLLTQEQWDKLSILI